MQSVSMEKCPFRAARRAEIRVARDGGTVMRGTTVGQYLCCLYIKLPERHVKAGTTGKRYKKLQPRMHETCLPDRSGFWPAGFTPPQEPCAASELRLLRRRGFSLASLD